MEILVVRIIKALAEVGGMFLIGQGLLFVLTGQKREQNFMFQLFTILTRPIMRIARVITPRAISDPHLPIAAFMLLFWVWIVAVLVLANLCAGGGVPGCPVPAAS